MSDLKSVLLTQIHGSEREIEAIENKIASSDNLHTTPSDFAAMRSEQERHRQEALGCKASIDETLVHEHEKRNKND